jgi:membrane-anchored mycosin MYCP
VPAALTAHVVLAEPGARPSMAGQLPGPAVGCPGGQGAAPPTTTPWAQRALSFSSVWGLAEGAGVTVAVIDSGVDANPQFGDRVTVGPDLSGGGTGLSAGADCVGHGTAVASIIAAAPRDGVSFSGVAPQVQVLSIKITNSETIASGVTATAIRDAVGLGASVINLPLAGADTPRLRSAVQFAQANDVVLVAAAGNDNASSGGTRAGHRRSQPPFVRDEIWIFLTDAADTATSQLSPPEAPDGTVRPLRQQADEPDRAAAGRRLRQCDRPD